MSRAPWELLPFFQAPSLQLAALTNVAKSIIVADPMRVLLAFFPTTAGAYTISTNSNVITANGINIPTTGQPLILNQSWWGPIVNMQWYGVAVGALNAPFMALAMQSWPSDLADKKPSMDEIAAAIQRFSHRQ